MRGWKGTVNPMKKVAVTDLKDDLSKFLRLAETEPILITRHGRPAGILMGFASENEWFDYQIENDPRFLARIQRARDSLGKGQGVKLDTLTATKTRKKTR
jgi:prevent-host-death family protein